MLNQVYLWYYFSLETRNKFKYKLQKKQKYFAEKHVIIENKTNISEMNNIYFLLY